MNKIKKYNYVFKMAILGAENYLLIVSRVNPDSIESIP